jgi:hypothetical protein
MRWLPWLLIVSACGSHARAVDAASCDARQYPCGPYGYGPGTVMANLTLVGQRDLNGDGSAVDDPAAPIQLADYFHANGLGALALVIGAESCVPCQNEQPMLVQLYRAYGARVAFLEAIVQSSSGAPADQQVIDNWALRYALPFDITADPTQALAPYYPANTFPSAMAIRLADMRITYQMVGPADGLQAALDQILR